MALVIVVYFAEAFPAVLKQNIVPSLLVPLASAAPTIVTSALFP